MRSAFGLCLAAGLVSACATPEPASATYKVIDPGGYQSFVANWEPEDQPLCAAIQSDADWKRVMRPAAVMGQNRPFAPPDGYWEKNALLLLSRVSAPAADGVKLFEVQDVKITVQDAIIAYRFNQPPARSYTIKAPLLVQVAKPLPPKIAFEQDGKVICTTTPGGSSPAIRGN